MKNILYISEGLDLPEQHLICGIADTGYNVKLLLSDTAEVPDLIKEQRIAHSFIPLEKRYSLKSIRAIHREIHAHQADVVHCLRNNRPLSNTIPALLNGPAKLVAYRGIPGSLGKYTLRAWSTYLNPRVNHISCVSNAVRDFFLSINVANDKVSTIYKGHDPSWYTPAPRETLEQFGIAKNDFVLACAGTLRPRKGVDLIIHALDKIPAATPIHLLLIGNITDRKVQQLIDNYNGPHHIHPIGYRDDASSLSGAADCCIMTTRDREGFPRAVIEAMSQGVPAIVNNVGGMPELVANEESGFVIPEGDIDTLAHAIIRMAENRELRERFGAASLKRVETQFHISQTIQKTVALYERLCS